MKHLWTMVGSGFNGTNWHARTYCGKRLKIKAKDAYHLNDPVWKADCGACISERVSDDLEAEDQLTGWMQEYEE